MDLCVPIKILIIPAELRKRLPCRWDLSLHKKEGQPALPTQPTMPFRQASPTCTRRRSNCCTPRPQARPCPRSSFPFCLPHRPHRPPHPRPSCEVAFLKFENNLLSSLPISCPPSQLPLSYECINYVSHVSFYWFFFLSSFFFLPSLPQNLDALASTPLLFKAGFSILWLVLIGLDRTCSAR